MRIYIETLVAGNYLEIIRRFDRDLFLALKPPGMSLELIRFDGSKKEDVVELRLSPVAGLFPQAWTSTITENGENEQEAWFTDEGTKLPFFLSKWKHRHIVRKVNENQSLIIDDIEYEGANFIFSALLYAPMYGQFYLRKPIYRRYFGKV